MPEKIIMYLVTVHRKDGHIFNYEVPKHNLREWLKQCSAVLLPGEALCYSEI